MRHIVVDKIPEVVYHALHHGIFNLEKPSTKIRVVFNYSSSITNGCSLNSIQYNGGIIQRDLYSVKLKFRKYIYALSDDIKKMYCMIRLDPSHYNLQRIFRCENTSETFKNL